VKRLLAALLFVGAQAMLAAAPEWRETTWHGEPALASSSQGWRAVISLTRARLMHFGPDGSDVNLLLAPPDRSNPNVLGGHRLWLGPQSTWPHGWPPPAAWEYLPPESHAVNSGALRLVLASTHDGWPRLTRTYEWRGAELVCGGEISGGDHPVQLVHILQVPRGAVISAEVVPETAFPAGYVLLPSTAGPFAAQFSPPAHVTLAGKTATLHHAETVLKVGFRPQLLVARVAGYELRVQRGALTGTAGQQPDAGFLTQVYLGGGEAFNEVEQLSPLMAAGQPARFEIAVSGVAVR
jgi:hypothetical protein